MEKKQTAIEFLFEEIKKLTGLNIANDEPIIEQAKKMEKQQIIDAYKSGRTDVINKNNINPIQYYNETFKEQ